MWGLPIGPDSIELGNVSLPQLRSHVAGTMPPSVRTLRLLFLWALLAAETSRTDPPDMRHVREGSGQG